MLLKLSIANYKSFGAKQTIEFARPSENSVGMTVLVGPNNTGKSTALSAIRRMFDNGQFFKASREDRRGDKVVGIDVNYETTRPEDIGFGVPMAVRLEGQADGAYYSKKLVYEGNAENVKHALNQANLLPLTFLNVKSISCRRPWNDGFSANRIARPTYAREAEDQFRGEEPNAQTGSLAPALFALERQGKKADFDKLLKSILPEIHEWRVDCPVDADYVCYKTPSGAVHRLSLTGEGIINVFRIAFTLLHLEPGDVVLIDEPELSLYPQAQKRLAKTLLKLSKNNQIIVATHSPYFVSWPALAKGAKIWRQTLNDAGDTVCGTISASTLKAIIKVVDSDIKNRRLYDVAAKEVFFADTVTFTEGPEDVHFIENYLKDEEELPMFGYGSGGWSNLESFLKMADELGIRAAALFDGDKADEYEKAKVAWKDKPHIGVFKLFKDDIRDKTKETVEVKAKEGVFDNKGVVHPASEAQFKELISSIRAHLKPSPPK